MESPLHIAKRFRELFDGKWIANTNYKDQLANLTWEQAVHQVSELNSIAALTFHVNYYINGLNEVFAGGDLTIRDKYSFDLPAIKSQEAWEQLRDQLFASAAAFADHVEQMTAEQLDGPFVKEQYGTNRRNIEGIIEHCYYHLGQVVLLGRMLG